MRRAFPLLLVSLIPALVFPAPASAVAHDDGDDARPIGSIPYLDLTDTSDATTEQGEDTSRCAPSGATVWYRIDAPTAPLVISTEGSGYDTVVTVFSGSPFTDRWIGCNDDALGTRQSRVVIAPTSSHLYPLYVQVGGYAGDTGSLRLNVVRAGTISGTVTDASGDPFERACIRATDAWGAPMSATSRGDGTYTISRVPSGTYDVWAEPCDQRTPGAAYPGGPVTVADAQDVTGIDVALPDPSPPPEPGQGVISGTVTAGGTAAQACVSLYFHTGWLARALPTDAAGAFTLALLSPGSYYLLADDACGWSNADWYGGEPDAPPYRREWFDDASSFGAATPIVLTEAETVLVGMDLSALPGPDLDVISVRRNAAMESGDGHLRFEIVVENVGAGWSRFTAIDLRVCPATLGPCSWTVAALAALPPGAGGVATAHWRPSVAAGRLDLLAIVSAAYDTDPSNDEGTGTAHHVVDAPVGVRICPGGCP